MSSEENPHHLYHLWTQSVVHVRVHNQTRNQSLSPCVGGCWAHTPTAESELDLPICFAALVILSATLLISRWKQETLMFCLPRSAKKKTDGITNQGSHSLVFSYVCQFLFLSSPGGLTWKCFFFWVRGILVHKCTRPSAHKWTASDICSYRQFMVSKPSHFSVFELLGGGGREDRKQARNKMPTLTAERRQFKPLSHYVHWVTHFW